MFTQNDLTLDFMMKLSVHQGEDSLAWLVLILEGDRNSPIAIVYIVCLTTKTITTTVVDGKPIENVETP